MLKVQNLIKNTPSRLHHIHQRYPIVNMIQVINKEARATQ